MLRAIVNKKTILNPLAKIQTVVDKKTTMQLLNNVLIGVEGDRLLLEATDLEISYKGVFPAEIEEQGEITVNAKRLYEIVRELPTDSFLIEQLPEDWIRISIGEKGEYKLGGLPVDNFPRFTLFDRHFEIKIGAEQLRNMLKKTVIAVATDESKYALTGLLFEYDPETNAIRSVGSDSHRLNMQEIGLEAKESDEKEEVSVIIPRKAVMEMIKLVEYSQTDSKEKIYAKISTDNKLLHLETDFENLNLRLHEGSYPDYKLIIPEQRNRYLFFERDEMLSALKRIAIVNPDPDVKSVKMTFYSGESLIESISTESSNAKEKVPVEYNGEEFEMALNARYMIDTLTVMESKKIRLTLNDNESPCILEGEEDKGFLALIMPMTLGDDY